jgi:hypothetical protein
MVGSSVSVVIPTYNSGRFLAQALDSVLAQTLPPEEVIVVDDGSRDDTSDRVKPYAGRVRVIRQENQGVAAARNRGLGEATGDVIAFLDADDVWHPRKLEMQVQALAENPDLVLLGTALFDWPGQVPAMTAVSTRDVTPVSYRRLVVKNYFATSALVVRRQALEKAGTFDTALSGPEDYDLWLRVAALGPVGNLNLALTGYRSVVGSLSKHAVNMEAGMRRILQKLDERKGWLGDGLLRRKATSYCDYSCAYMYAASGQRLRAAGNLLRSLARYPLPFARGEVKMAWARPKLLGMTLWRMIADLPRARSERSDSRAVLAGRGVD